MKIKNIIIILAILFYTNLGYSQEQKLCKTWYIEYSTLAGKKEIPTTKEKDNRMVFDKDHRFIGFDEELALVGKWKLDKKTKTIIIQSNEFKVNMKFKIVTLNDNDLIIDVNNGMGKMKRIFMKPRI